eukprot:UN34835
MKGLMSKKQYNKALEIFFDMEQNKIKPDTLSIPLIIDVLENLDVSEIVFESEFEKGKFNALKLADKLYSRASLEGLVPEHWSRSDVNTIIAPEELSMAAACIRLAMKHELAPHFPPNMDPNVILRPNMIYQSQCNK